MTSPTFDEAYKKLNPAQKKAVDTIDGPVLVVAGPGSGKTEILSLRVANILAKADVRPSNILCLTFTESAAANMRRRLERFIGRDAFRVSINTFHGFAMDIISRYPEHFYNAAKIEPADDLAQIEIMTGIFSGMPHDGPLSSVHPEQGFVYLNSARRAIGELKKAGLSPEEFEKILEHNESCYSYVNEAISEMFPPRLSVKSFDGIEKAASNMIAKKMPPAPLPFFPSANVAIGESLLRAARVAKETGETKPLSAWKDRYTSKRADGKRVIKDSERLPKMKALADVYKKYRDEMYSAGYCDFDDMIMEVIGSAERNETLRAELREQYQYILVDEFQDTNDGQMRLLSVIANAPENEGRPNLMAVGDDDQAVYKFQGATVSNILDFAKRYNDPAVVTMAANYRSTQEILDAAQTIIRKGEERLENLLPELDKKLTAANAEIPKGFIKAKIFPSNIHEYHFIAKEIASKIASGEKPSDIAIISRRHAELERIVPYLHRAGVPVEYERQQNVLDEPHIRELITMGRFVATVGRKDILPADHLLPEILSFGFWGLPRQSVWKLSLDAYRNRTTWLEEMNRSGDPAVKAIADFLTETGVASVSEPLEYVIDRLVGGSVTVSEDDEEAPAPQGKAVSGSPFRKFYWSEEAFKSNKPEYLTFLSSLRVFMRAIREFRKGKPLSIADLVSFADMHESNDLLVTDNSPFMNAFESVKLMTAHKAKGLEFGTVFLLSCQQEVWAGKGRSGLLPMPMNLPIEPAGENEDDQLRLFYVALTRAKRNLFITAHQVNDAGKETSNLGFLEGSGHIAFDRESEKASEITGIGEVLMESWRLRHRPPHVAEEKALLSHLVEDYQMSVTHLNNFIDVTRGGPQAFFEQNLVRFPQAKTVSGSFGTAVHSAIEETYSYLRREGKMPAIGEIERWFEKTLRAERLSETDHSKQAERGKKCLRLFIETKGTSFDPSHRIETDFKHQGVIVGGARLTGKIDKIVMSAAGIFVHDFKTGKPAKSWNGSSPEEKVKLHKYRNQLAFYRLLLENSRDWSDRKMIEAVLEFVEPDEDGELRELRLAVDDGLAERTGKLAEAVYKKIIALDFPDVSGYPQTLEGVERFEDDLIEGKI